MSYINARRRRGGLGAVVIGGVAVDENGARVAGDNEAGLAQGNAATASLDAQITDFAQTWNPTGVFTPEQMIAIRAQVFALMGQAIDGIALAPTPDSITDAATTVRNDLDRLRDASLGSDKFGAAIIEAQKKGVTQIIAPDFKQWAVNAMLQCSSSLTDAAFLACEQSAFEQLAAYLANVFDGALARVIAFIKRILGIALRAAEAAIEVAGDLVWIVEQAVPIAMAAGAAWLYWKYVYKKKGARARR